MNGVVLLRTCSRQANHQAETRTPRPQVQSVPYSIIATGPQATADIAQRKELRLSPQRLVMPTTPTHTVTLALSRVRLIILTLRADA